MSLEREDLGWGYMTSGLAALMCQEPPIRSPHVQLRFQGQIRIKHKEKFEEKQVDLGSSPTPTCHGSGVRQIKSPV